MAKYNEILTGRHNKFLTRFFGMKGPAPSPQISGDFQPSISIQIGREVRWLENWMVYGVYASSPAAALNLSAARFRNPSKNIIAVIEKIMVRGQGVGTNFVLQYGQPGADLATILIKRSMDGRKVGDSSLIVSVGNAAGGSQIGTSVIGANTPAGNSIELVQDNIQEIVVGPGDAVQLQEQTTANQAFDVSFFWRERVLEESELS